APLLMLLIRRFNFWVSLMAGLFLLMIALLISICDAPFLFLHTPIFVFSTTFFGHFVEFFAGVFVALLILGREKQQAPAASGRKWTITGSIGVMILITMVIFIQCRKGPFRQFLYIGINNFILPLPIAILYFGLITEKTFLSRLLSGRLLGLMGRTSYSFYLVHMLVIDFIAVPYLLKYFTGFYNLYVIVIYILTQLIALLIFVFYEEPLNLFIRNKFRKRQRNAV
ncbi:MAG TPA: hypothetical protein VIV35_09275, partial [Chitinophagaceae bacterium]